jgi:nicotinamide riboside transporter PnuC
LAKVYALWLDMRQSGRESDLVRRLEAKSYAATIVAAAVATVVFAWGLFTFVAFEESASGSGEDLHLFRVPIVFR